MNSKSSWPSYSTNDLEKLYHKLETLDEESVRQIFLVLTRDLVDRCADDGLFWLQFVQTRDEADPAHSIKPFPVQLDYLRELWNLLSQIPRVIVAKSRQMLVSWLVAAYCVWRARFHAHQAIYWQTQQWKDAVAMTCMPEGGFMGRCQFIEANLPAWMHVPIKFSEGCQNYGNGSLIQALAGGADQVRGKVATVIVLDEFARQEEATGVWTAVAPLVQKGAQVIIVSTPNGSENQFATLYHGRPASRG